MTQVVTPATRLQDLSTWDNPADKLLQTFPPIQPQVVVQYSKTRAATAALFAALVSYGYKPTRGRPLVSIIVTLIVGGVAYLLSKKTTVLNQVALTEREQHIHDLFEGVAALLHSTWQATSWTISQRVSAGQHQTLEAAQQAAIQLFADYKANPSDPFIAAEALARFDTIDPSDQVDDRARLIWNQILEEAKRLAYGKPENKRGESPYVCNFLVNNHPPCHSASWASQASFKDLCPKQFLTT